MFLVGSISSPFILYESVADYRGDDNVACCQIFLVLITVYIVATSNVLDGLCSGIKTSCSA